MRKLSLDLDSLDVQSFDPTPQDSAPRGTVRGHATDNLDCTQWGSMCPSWYDAYTGCMVSDLGTCSTCNGGQTSVTCAGVECEADW